jgi:hypothetical protein
MTNLLHHIGLQVIEKDISSFYTNVLGCVTKWVFKLLKEDAVQIFNINKDVEIVYTQCENLELELFIDNKPKESNFNHICILTDKDVEIVNRAKMGGFRVFTREKKDKTKTYFVSDSNNNIFEIKNNNK